MSEELLNKEWDDGEPGVMRRDAGAADLPIKDWPSAPGGTPNAFNRSSIFTAGGRKEPSDLPQACGRPWLNNVMIAAMPGYEIRYTGPELNQTDKMVFQHLVRIMREDGVAAGREMELSGYRILTEMGKGDGRENYRWLEASINRLWEATIRFVKTRDGAFRDIRILITGGRDEESKKFCVAFHPYVALLHESDVALINLERKGSLGPLASFLHDFYSSHRIATPMMVAEIKRLSGRECEDKAFRRELRNALKELETCAPALLKPGSQVVRNRVVAEKAESAVVYIAKKLKQVDIDAVIPSKKPVRKKGTGLGRVAL
jgi:hypothetical protein